MIRSRLLTTLALAGAGLALSACVTIFPKTKPVQMYRFEAATPTAAAAADTAGQTMPIAVGRAPTSFERGAEGDRILTVTGDQVAYIAGGRWVSPAAVLFDAAESQAFDQSQTRLRLDRRGELNLAPVSLRLDVESFEVRYDGGAPTVVVRVEASLTRTADRKIIAVRAFESRQTPQADRIGAIVTGYDAAVSDVLSQIVTWTAAETPT